MKGNIKWLYVGVAVVLAALGALEAAGVIPRGLVAAFRMLAAVAGVPVVPVGP